MLKFCQGIGIDAEAVILAGDFNPAGPEVFHRVVCAVVAEFELVGLGAERKGEELMAETDAEDGQPAEEFPYCLNRVSDGSGVTGAVAQEYATGPDEAPLADCPITRPKLFWQRLKRDFLPRRTLSAKEILDSSAGFCYN